MIGDNLKQKDIRKALASKQIPTWEFGGNQPKRNWMHKAAKSPFQRRIDSLVMRKARKRAIEVASREMLRTIFK